MASHCRLTSSQMCAYSAVAQGEPQTDWGVDACKVALIYGLAPVRQANLIKFGRRLLCSSHAPVAMLYAGIKLLASLLSLWHTL